MRWPGGGGLHGQGPPSSCLLSLPWSSPISAQLESDGRAAAGLRPRPSPAVASTQNAVAASLVRFPRRAGPWVLAASFSAWAVAALNPRRPPRTPGEPPEREFGV